MKDDYNLRYVSKPTKVVDLIKQKQRLISWDLFPNKKELDQLFIGRTEQLKQFQTRIYDIDTQYPNCIIVSGLNAIGRRKFLKHSLINSNTIRAEYVSPIITLDYRCSIEAFIVRIYGLGYSQMDSSEVTNLLKKTIDEKVSIATALLKEIEDSDNILFIEDNNAIVARDGNIPDWFIQIVENISDSPNTILCLISLSRVRALFPIRNKFLFCLEIPELEKAERIGLFTSLLKIGRQDLNRKDLVLISDQFKGFPEQIFYTVELLRSEGVQSILSNLHLIIEYNTEKVSRLIKQYERNVLGMQLLKILSEYEFISLEMLEKILGEDFEDSKPIISQLSYESIIEYIGSVKENLRLNDAIRDYIQRSSYKMDDKYKNNLKKHVKENIQNYAEDLDRDISDYVISVKEALKQGLDVPSEFLIPSHFVNAMRELYNYERRLDEVVLLANRVLKNPEYLDEKIVREIRYWLCLSLARKRDERFLAEIQKISGVDHNFLLGFYYRLTGRFDDALIRLNRVLGEVPNYYRAKRELIQVYLNKEEFDLAFDLAEETYSLDKYNPYNIQSYFRCLLKLEGKSAKSTLEKLLDDLKNNINPKADEMYRTSLTQFYAQIENDEEKALNTVNETILLYPKKIYPYLTKLEILNHSNNLGEINKVLLLIEERFDKTSEIWRKLHYLLAKCKILKADGKITEAKQILNSDIKKNFSQSLFQKCETELSL
ncbi:hypothetical protein EZS27_027609 [termite gut metagenome]|uniref:Uncharacterized protein n=1 Tax=termite gut metagenome TaxID=433724 RepID=A0A5J4QLS4_9ZZZZ